MEKDYLPWLESSREERDAQLVFQKKFCVEHKNCTFGNDSFLSEGAKLYGIRSFSLGENSWVAADVLIREADIRIGNNSSVNSYAYLQGKIQIGNHVRIAPKASIIAMNHVHNNPEKLIVEQGICEKGIRVEDDVWIDAGAMILDGVTVGAHSVIGAGSVVTKDIPPYSVAAGNPAKVIKDRRESVSSLREKLAAFSEHVKDSLTRVIEQFRTETGYVGRMNDSRRAICDATEIYAMFGEIPEKEWRIKTITALQKDSVDYDCLTVGYALEVLGTHISRPFDIRGSIGNMTKWLEGRPWKKDAWCAGNDVDCLGTAIYQNRKYFCDPELTEELFSWLDSHCSPTSGTWGEGLGDLLMPVNGFYRLTRGTYAQFGRPLPYPEAAIDTVLRHSRNEKYFGKDRGTACEVLDIIHPLWLCYKQTDYRKEEGLDFAKRQVERILRNWNNGFSFELDGQHEPSLMGTEMWLSILYLIADLLGMAECLCYRPKGVHRTEVALRI